MAGSSFFALLDDIASIMDDVAILSKLSAQKTSAVLGDDLALNSQQLIGLSAKRELPVVFAVAKGSLINKIIIVPCALLISFFSPGLISPLLMLGGLYLCYEGVEKILHTLFEKKNKATKKPSKNLDPLINSKIDLVQLEKDKIKGAIRTDFILSAEIIVISLGITAASPLLTQCFVLASISLLMTVGVYGLVAVIIKLDDLGLHLLPRPKLAWLGNFFLSFAPKLMKFLSGAGTLAMFLVGGGILVHGILPIHHFLDQMQLSNRFLKLIVTSAGEGLIGIIFGLLAFLLVKVVSKMKKKMRNIT
ncbi:MAG: DUF808 domain-containing protein [Bacteriovoracaceae bacterium]|nr:DUF808 domain-containing protein [Bacteriovoracaceae bacterium]